MTVKEAAYELDVSDRTLRRWIDCGKIDARDVGPTNRVRIPREAVEDAKKLRERQDK